MTRVLTLFTILFMGPFYSTAQCLQLGIDLAGEASIDLFGNCVSMNEVGPQRVTRAPQNGGMGVDDGHARVC